MGYTHYFTQHRDATSEEWQKITDDFRAMLDIRALPPIQFEDDDESGPQIDEEVIRFNGVGAYGHETMILSREGNGFNFCKTAEKPYDAAVTALLTLTHHHAPGCWGIGSDGGPDDWEEGVAIVTALRPAATNPHEGVTHGK